MLRGNLTQCIYNREVRGEIVALKARVLPPPIIIGQFIQATESAC